MTKEDVNPLKEDGTAKSPAEIEAEVVAGNANPAPGSQTDPAKLLISLQEEREKRRIAEESVTALSEELTLLENSLANPDVTTEEGRALKRQIDESRTQIENLTKDLTKKDIFIEHPILKEKATEFETFLADPENKGMSLKTAAKAFLVENGLLDAKRPGLERPTGGDRQPPSTKMSAEDVKVLRETNFKKYQELLQKGLIEV
jgi:hypothetical protein